MTNLGPGEVTRVIHEAGRQEYGGRVVKFLENRRGLIIEISVAIVKSEEDWFGWQRSRVVEEGGQVGQRNNLVMVVGKVLEVGAEVFRGDIKAGIA